jgi:hypothetical protein
MRTASFTILPAALAMALAASLACATDLDGTVKLGGIIRNQAGDRTTTQETFNVYDGFSLSQIALQGMLTPRQYVALDLQEINLDSRQADLVYRLPGIVKVTADYRQHRQIFSPDGDVHSMRKDWRTGAEVTPLRWLELTGHLDSQTRDGDRLSFPLGVLSALGTAYDNHLLTGDVGAQVRGNGRGAAVTYSASSFTDDLDPDAHRTGQLISARLWSPCRFSPRLSHFVRAAWGVRRLSNRDLEYRLGLFEYTGVLRPIDALQLRYNFDARRIDDQATRLKTDRFENAIDATWFNRYGQWNGGYAYETNDDDQTLTHFNTWHAGAGLRLGRRVDANLDFASRAKKDEAEVTLLRDVDATQVRARLQIRPDDALVLGAGFSRRERDFTDIGVDLQGDEVHVFGSYAYPAWGTLSGDYAYTNDDDRDRSGSFHLHSHVVTGRAELDRIPHLKVASGVTWLRMQRDLDIEKSLVFVEGVLTPVKDYHLEVKYNAYNYDDYILLDRYYTANVLRINLAYDLHVR